jgi:hypothetical protein
MIGRHQEPWTWTSSTPTVAAGVYDADGALVAIVPDDDTARRLAAIPRLLDALRLARSMIRSGEAMSPEAAGAIDAAIEAVKR